MWEGQTVMPEIESAAVQQVRHGAMSCCKQSLASPTSVCCITDLQKPWTKYWHSTYFKTALNLENS